MVFKLLISREARSLRGLSWVCEAQPEKVQYYKGGETKEQFKIEVPFVVFTSITALGFFGYLQLI